MPSTTASTLVLNIPGNRCSIRESENLRHSAASLEHSVNISANQLEAHAVTVQAVRQSATTEDLRCQRSRLAASLPSAIMQGHNSP